MNQSVEIDKRYGCPRDSQHIGTSMSILLDATDPYAVSQVKQVANIIFDRVDSLDPYDRVKIYMVGDTSKEQWRRPVFHRCIPDPESSEMPIFKRLQKVTFTTFLEDALSKIQGSENQSPIIESLGWMAADFERDPSTKIVVLVSDLIENSEVVSMYSSGWLKEAESNSRRISSKQPMLREIDVELVILARPAIETQNETLLEWWIKFLGQSGGFVTESRTVSG